MTELAQLPAAFLENIDWVNQPPPTQARDTHALHFYLNAHPVSDTSAGYQGLMFYRQGVQPTSSITQRQNGLDGTGRLFRGEPVGVAGLGGADWARVIVRFRTQPTARIMVALFLHSGNGPHNLPGTQVRVVDFAEVEPTVADTLDLDPGTSNHWELILTKTTVLL